jgi:hypothetical protein
MGLFSSIFRKRNKVKNPDGSKTVTITDRHGNVRKTKHRDAAGYKTKQFYDREGNLTKRKAKGPGMRRYKAKRRNFQNVTNAEFQPGRPWPGGAHMNYNQRNQTPITQQTSEGRRMVNTTNNVPPPPIPGMPGNPNQNVVYNPTSTVYQDQNVNAVNTTSTNTPTNTPPPAPTNNGLSPFEQAFKAARADQGPGGQFEFEGKQYNTNYKEEVEGARYGGRRPMVKALGGRMPNRRRGGALGRNRVL